LVNAFYQQLLWHSNHNHDCWQSQFLKHCLLLNVLMASTFSVRLSNVDVETAHVGDKLFWISRWSSVSVDCTIFWTDIWYRPLFVRLSLTQIICLHFLIAIFYTGKVNQRCDRPRMFTVETSRASAFTIILAVTIDLDYVNWWPVQYCPLQIPFILPFILRSWCMYLLYLEICNCQIL
jgi:hypothetical protein